MRLVRCSGQDDFSLASGLEQDEIPPYAILSHTWNQDDNQEVTFAEIVAHEGWWRIGYRKLEFCAEQASKDDLKYFWVDTCCINKADLYELSEAITSMYKWYRNAKKCYVYLSDVSTRTSDNGCRDKCEWEPEFRKSRWFTRGWTLQELLAPKRVEFFSKEGDLLGTKETLGVQIHEITTIPLAALQNKPLWQFSDVEKMRWTENRHTKKEEDNAYCLLGIFEIFMPLIYGEGKNALQRLKEEIEKKRIRDTGSQSIEQESVPQNREPILQHRADPIETGRGIQQNTNHGGENMNNIGNVAGQIVFNKVLTLNTRNDEAHGSPQSLTPSEKEFLASIGLRKFWYVDDRVEGTCTWTIESAQYKSWLAATKSSVLWITGAAGTGKTTLANFLAEQLEQCYPSRDAGLTDYIVCSFFCSRGIEGRHDVLSLLRDLILQLAQPRKKIIRMIKSMYGTGKQESDLSIYRAWQMFGTVLSTLTCQSLFIVIDALDECDNSSRVQLLKRLASTVSSVTTKSPAACKVIKIIFTGQPQIRTSWSRTSKDVEHYQIDIDDRSTGISHDLDLFIEVRVDELVTENSYSSDVGQDLKATLKSMAETSFLWLDTILKHIQQSLAYKLDDVKSLLANVPDDLYQAYTKYLPPLPSNDQTTLQRYLQLLVACSRPLQLAEIDILIESDHETATRMLAAGSANSNVVRASMQRALGPLVRFPRNTAQLCHSTARDFFLAISQQPENPLFQSHGVDMGSAHFLCAKLCMSYLLHPSLPSDMFSKHICDSTSIDAASPTSDHSQSEDQDFLTNMFDIEDVAFLRDADVLESETCAVINQQCEAFDYAALNWTYHMKKLGKRLDRHLTTMALSLMTGEKGRASDWYRYQKHRSCLQMPAQEAINAIVLAATYDLDDLLEALFNDSSFQYHEEWLSEALFWASSRGCQDAVKVLLSFGAPVKSVRIHQVPLAVTAQGGYLDICSLLLESTDIDPNESNSRGKSPLIIAAEANHVGILRLVLKHKNILADKVDGDGRTAFIAACRSGSLESVQVLCEDNRIDINMVDIKGQTALHHASHFGHSLVVRKLLKIPDLDKSTVDLTGRNAISLASQHGHLDVVKLLIKHGIDPATRDKTGRNSISWAANSVKATVAESGQESVLKYLLRKAPHASDVPDCDGWTPLAWAMDPPGYVEAVEALLGIPYVDINRRDDDGLCTLAWAAASGMTEIVKRFLQSPNVDVNAASHRGTTPLMIAASEGKTAVVEVLLQCSQIDIDLKDEFGRTALDRATFTSHVDIVEMLQKYVQSQG